VLLCLAQPVEMTTPTQQTSRKALISLPPNPLDLSNRHAACNHLRTLAGARSARTERYEDEPAGSYTSQAGLLRPLSYVGDRVGAVGRSTDDK
jgi:hypothetical protein